MNYGTKDFRGKRFNLKFNGLEYIPEKITNNIDIINLDLSFNPIKVISKEISRLKNLEMLRISDFKLSNEVNKIMMKLEKIGDVTNLLSYGKNDCILCSLPKEIGLLNKLKYIYCGHSNLKGLPKSIGELKNLKLINIDNS